MGLEFVRFVLREAMSPPEMTDAEMRCRMAREVLEGTKDRLENSPPIGWDPVNKTDPHRACRCLKVLPPAHINEDEDNISDLHDYDDLDSRADAAAARGA